MPARSFMKWFPSDWRGDPLVRACEPITRYVWMEMLGLMYEAEPYGHLTLGGRALDYATLARVIAVESGVVKKAVKELEDRGVFSRTDKGTIYSRRMLREKIKGEIAHENGLKGGNPALKKSKTPKKILDENQGFSGSWDKGEDKIPDKPQDKTQIPDTRYQSPDGDSSGTSPRCSKSEKLGPTLESDCRRMVGQEPVVLAQDFWEIEKLLSEGVTEIDIKAGIESAMNAESFRPRAWAKIAPWCRRAAKDRLAGAPKKISGLSIQVSTEPMIDLRSGAAPMRESLLIGRLSEYRLDRDAWHDIWGYPPGHKLCRVPARLLAGLDWSKTTLQASWDAAKTEVIS